MAVAIAAAVVAAAAAGCDRSEKGDPMTSGTSQGSTSASDAAGRSALTDTGARLQEIIRGIVEPVQGMEKSYDTAPSTMSCKELAGDDPWPQQQSFNADVFVRGDSRPAARQVADRLRTDGWAVQDAGRLTGPQTQHYIARRDGYVVTIGSTVDDVATLAVGGSTPCVDADGSVKGSPG